MSQPEQYWAAMPADLFAEQLKDRIRKYYDYIRQHGLYDLWRRSERLCYGLDGEGGWANSSAVTFGGQQGEMVLLRANHYGSLAQSIVSITTGSRLSFNVQAINTDFESQSQADLAKGIVEYYYQEKHLEDTFIEALEHMLFVGEGWVELEWDYDKGDLYAFEAVATDAEGSVEMRPVYEGDVTARVRHPIDVARDPYREDMEHEWFAVRRLHNRWSLAARYPASREHILAASMVDGDTKGQWLWDWGRMEKRDVSDLIPVWKFYHAPSPALPMGRSVLVCGDYVLEDTFLGAPAIPMIPVIAQNRRKTAFGYSRMWDLMAVQEAYDSIISTQVTNHDAAGLINLWTPIGDSLTAEEVAFGLQYIQSREPPQVIQANPSSPSSAKLEEQFVRLLETLSGVNAVARGNPPPALASGSALALVQSMAIEYNSQIQRAYGNGVGDGLTMVIELLQKNANSARVAMVAGKSQQPFLKQFTGKDIKAARKVVVDVGAPLLNSAAGRLQLGEQMMAVDAITPEQLLEIVRTGRLDSIFETQRSERLNIKAENEMLAEGQLPRALVTDDHALHIQEHKVVLNNPLFRFNNVITDVVTQHMQEHHDLYVNTVPTMLFLSGQEPPDPMMLMDGGMAPPPSAGAGGPPPGGDEGGQPNAKAPEGAPPGVKAKMPNMPKNPLAGKNQPKEK